MYMCVFTCVRAYLCEWIQVHRCAFGGQKQMLAVFLNCSLPYKLMQSLSAKPRAWHVCGFWQSELWPFVLTPQAF